MTPLRRAADLRASLVTSPPGGADFVAMFQLGLSQRAHERYLAFGIQC